MATSEASSRLKIASQKGRMPLLYATPMPRHPLKWRQAALAARCPALGSEITILLQLFCLTNRFVTHTWSTCRRRKVVGFIQATNVAEDATAAIMRASRERSCGLCMREHEFKKCRYGSKPHPLLSSTHPSLRVIARYPSSSACLKMLPNFSLVLPLASLCRTALAHPSTPVAIHDKRYLLISPLILTTHLNTTSEHCYKPPSSIRQGEPTKSDCRAAIVKILYAATPSLPFLLRLFPPFITFSTNKRHPPPAQNPI